MTPDIDHLVFGAPDLAAGVDAIERQLGVRPAPGGRHPQFGTHNALASLGTESYFEVIAPVPDLPPPDRGLVFDLHSVRAPRLVTWALRVEDLDDAAGRARAAGFDVGRTIAGHREAADGTRFSWRSSDPRAMRFGGAAPFLISWGATPHPAASAPPVGELIAFHVEHPAAEKVRAALRALGADVEVRAASEVRLVATIRTAGGDVTIT